MSGADDTGFYSNFFKEKVRILGEMYMKCMQQREISALLGRFTLTNKTGEKEL